MLAKYKYSRYGHGRWNIIECYSINISFGFMKRGADGHFIHTVFSKDDNDKVITAYSKDIDNFHVEFDGIPEDIDILRVKVIITSDKDSYKLSVINASRTVYLMNENGNTIETM